MSSWQNETLWKDSPIHAEFQEGGKGGGLNHESREINEVSRKISAGWNDYRAVGAKCNERMSMINCSVRFQKVWHQKIWMKIV